MKNTLLITSWLLLISFQVKSQTVQDSLLLEKADTSFESGKFKKAKKIYEEFALEFNSSTVLYKAALAHEKITGENYCLYFKAMMNKGFEMLPPVLFFYGCDPETFEQFPIGSVK